MSEFPTVAAAVHQNGPPQLQPETEPEHQQPSEPSQQQQQQHSSLFPITFHTQGLRDRVKEKVGINHFVSFLIMISLPVNMTMVVLGFAHRHDCPADVRIPQFLLFGGLAGCTVIFFKILIIMTSKNIQMQFGAGYDPSNHPGLSMVRCVMYIFVLFVVIYHVEATPRILHMLPDLENVASEIYCDKAVYYVSYVLVVTFDIVAGTAVLIWVLAIIAGICNPHLLVINGYYPSTSEAQYHIMSKRMAWKRRSKKIREKDRRKKETEKAVLRLSRALKLEEGEEEDKKKEKRENGSVENGGSQADSERNATVDRANLSIVRFSREIESRRISVDYWGAGGGGGGGGGPATPAPKSNNRFNIKKFPSGPMSEALEEEEAEKETKIRE